MLHGEIIKKTKGEAQLIFENGFALLQKGELEEADVLFLRAHQLDPSNTETLNLLGIRSYQKQDYKTALALLEKADQLSPHSAQTLSNLGLVHNALLEFNEALHFFHLAINREPRIPEIHNNFGNALKGLHRNHEAIEAYEKAISLRGNYAEAISNKGVIFLEEGAIEKAIALFEQAIQINPGLATAFNSLGNALSQLDRYEDAFQCFERALQINPVYLDACLNFGSSLKKYKQFSAAIDCYQHALKLHPNNARTFYLLGDVYYDTGDSALAKTYLSKSLKLKPLDIESQYMLAIAQIPKVYKSQEEVSLSRELFSKQVECLENNSQHQCESKKIIKAISRHPFYLAYQQENNKRLLSQFGLTCAKHGQRIQDQLTTFHQIPKSDNRIRIGIISNYFFNHPVWNAITKGWVSHLNRDAFEIFIFNTNGTEDSETTETKPKVSKYVNCGNDVSIAAQIILDQNLDVLLYPEIGMDPTTKGLACLRLAPLQAVSWGHPETTGLPTLDFFLSAKLLEPDEANSHYSEQLIELPNLGTYFESPSNVATSINLKNLGLNEDSPMLLCCGSPSKYTPLHDEIFVGIAKKLGECQFVFFDFDENLTALLKGRLCHAFSDAKLNSSNFIRFIPFLQKEELQGLMYKADLYLDTIGFSGFNTAMQAIDCNLPIVAVEDKFMRGQFASAILQKLNLSELICQTKEAYIDMTVKIIQNKDFLNSLRERIFKSKHVLYCDLEPIRALEAFLIQYFKH